MAVFLVLYISMIFFLPLASHLKEWFYYIHIFMTFMDSLNFFLQLPIREWKGVSCLPVGRNPWRYWTDAVFLWLFPGCSIKNGKNATVSLAQETADAWDTWLWLKNFWRAFKTLFVYKLSQMVTSLLHSLPSSNGKRCGRLKYSQHTTFPFTKSLN